ncbi:MAG: xanthine dehydrogenase family protein molybdopterin-binding subunit, partial [bacterium]
MKKVFEFGDSVGPGRSGGRTPRTEDLRLLVGAGTFVADVELAGCADAVFVRSQVAHARLLSIDATEARAHVGVFAVHQARDMDGLGSVPDAETRARPVHWSPLARDRIRHVGAPVAVVAAVDRYVAEDAAELVRIAYDELPSLSSADAAAKDGAPRLYDDWPDNYIARIDRLDPDLDALFAKSRVIRGTYRIQRQAAMPMETRGVAAEFKRGRLTVWTSTQVPHVERTVLSRMLRMSESAIQVIAPDVGGGFGGKLHVYPEDAVVAWLAIHLGRPVRWIEDRREHFLGSIHAREETIELEGAIGDDGCLLALRARVTADLGSGETYPPGTAVPFVSAASLTGAYRIERSIASVRCLVTNKTPSGAYRGFGTPEMVFATERFLDRVAHETGYD